jgi:type III pantothenate kinase
MTTTPGATPDDLLIKLRGMLAKNKFAPDDIDGAIISSVVPELTDSWRKAAATIANADALIVSSECCDGLKLKFDNPDALGADRIADVVGAIGLYGVPVIVIDMGTATNIEVIDKRGVYVGGIIAPGMETSANALFKSAARIGRFDIEASTGVIGKDTAQSVQAGIVDGEADRIDGLVKRIFDELGYHARVVATGGLARHVADLSHTIDDVNDDLTLEGLRRIYLRTVIPSLTGNLPR